MTDSEKANPDVLLKSVSRLEKQQGRGKLRVFLGMCPGVGKTYSMLRSAAEQAKKGVRVIVGVAETHGRADTAALLAELKVFPRKKTTYKETLLEEMDLDGLLAAGADLILVDELAHTNAPASRHPKRYQDVEELLSAGIDVYTTLNVQHIESRADLVHQITGVHVRETVPDQFLELADQIELIDLAPMELLRRLNEGKVYLGEGAESAARNFFKEEHLTALRELALRFTAEKVDHELQEHMTVKRIAGPWNTSERLLVAISHSPYSQRLLRATRRMAYNLEAPWIALYVDAGARLSEEDYAMLQSNMAQARRLGAELVTTLDTDVAAAIRRVANERNITQIVMGRPDRRWLKDFISGGTLLDQLVRETSKVDVHVIRQDRKPKFQGFQLRWPTLQSGFPQYLQTLGFLALVLAAGKFLEPVIGYRAVGFLFLLGVVVVSSVSNRGPILLAAALSAFFWNFLFIPPRFTFVISSYEDMMMCVAYFLVASVSGIFTTRIRRQQKLLLAREERANTLYDLARSLSEAKATREVCEAAKACVSRVFSAEINVWIANEDGSLGSEKGLTSVYDDVEKDFAVAQWSFQNKKRAGWGTDTLVGARCLSLPLLGKDPLRAIGVLLFYPNQKRALGIEQESFLDAIAHQLAIALERDLLGRKAETAKLLERSEALHQTLLNSVSHELRTPLTSIVGNATALQAVDTAESRKTLVDALVFSTGRLNRVVENLLDMSRIHSGTLQLKKEWFGVEEFVEDVIARMKSDLSPHPVHFSSGGAQALHCYGDYRLLDHALTNLLMNAAIYSPESAPITVEVREGPGGTCRISVKDVGVGLSEEGRSRVFEKFYRVPNSPAGGTGLGLSIVKSIADLHDGEVLVESEGMGKGSVFTIILKASKLGEF